MNLRQIAFLIVLALLPVARGWAQAYDAAGPRELYHAEVCNEGRIAADVAVAYKDFGFTDGFWMIDYWYRVEPGKCKLVFSHFYAPNNLFSFQSFPLYLAFAFTDSTGVWGAAKVNPARDTASSRLHLCVGRKNYEYRVNGKTPEAKCPKGLLIPAAIVWEPTRGVYAREFGGYPPPKRFTVVLGPNDRAIALGPQAQTTNVPSGPGTIRDFADVLSSIMKRAGRTSSDWSACIEPTVVKTHPWKDAPAAEVKSLQDAVLQFISPRKDKVRFRIVERSGRFVVEEYKGEFCNPFYGVG